MKRKKFHILTLFVLVIVGSSVAYGADDSLSIYREWGQILQENAKLKENSMNDGKINSDNIYEKGKSAVIEKDEIKNGIRYYQLAGLSEEEARREAINYFEKYEALYEKAKELGYNASEEEVDAYIGQMKASLHSQEMDVQSKKEFQMIIDQFDSEDDYWEYQKKIYMKSLPIEKYVQELEQNFFVKNPNASDEEWLKYFEEHKTKLAKEQKYQQ